MSLFIYCAVNIILVASFFFVIYKVFKASQVGQDSKLDSKKDN
ncbi:hypothetical protein [Helicobacter saguini]|nr:hypothetical protein [Helicobacter saguini]